MKVCFVSSSSIHCVCIMRSHVSNQASCAPFKSWQLLLYIQCSPSVEFLSHNWLNAKWLASFIVNIVVQYCKSSRIICTLVIVSQRFSSIIESVYVVEREIFGCLLQHEKNDTRLQSPFTWYSNQIRFSVVLQHSLCQNRSWDMTYHSGLLYLHSCTNSPCVYLPRAI